MRIVGQPMLLDRLLNVLMGSFVTLLMLSQFGRGDFIREAGFVLLAVVPLAAFDMWERWRDLSDGTPLRVHLIISLLAYLAFTGLFIAKYSFGVEAVGYWMFIPLIVFFWANWSADREAKAVHG